MEQSSFHHHQRFEPVRNIVGCWKHNSLRFHPHDRQQYEGSGRLEKLDPEYQRGRLEVGGFPRLISDGGEIISLTELTSYLVGNGVRKKKRRLTCVGTTSS